MFNNRDEWLQWRKGGIGSSDVPIIMGVSPWSTPLKLYEEKIKTEVSEENGSYITDKGNEFEPRVRALFETWEGRSFSPACCEMDGDFNYLRVSLDGRSDDNEEICEIKLSGAEDWEASRDKGLVPAKYMPQMQYQLMVSGAKVCHYLTYKYTRGEKSVNGDNLIVIKVYPDAKYQEKMLEKVMKFWQENVLKKKPPEPSDKDYVTLKEKGAAAKMKKWKALDAKIELLKEQQKVIREELLALADTQGKPRYVLSDVQIRKESRKGNVEYSDIPAIKKMTEEELDKYRKAGSSSWKFVPIKKKKEKKDAE